MVSVGLNAIIILLGTVALAVLAGVLVAVLDVRRLARPATPAAAEPATTAEITQRAA